VALVWVMVTELQALWQVAEWWAQQWMAQCSAQCSALGRCWELVLSSERALCLA
jgi:hypothetical protein